MLILFVLADCWDQSSEDKPESFALLYLYNLQHNIDFQMV